MTFFRTLATSAAAIALISACGGGDASDSGATEKSVENPDVTTASSPATSPTATATADPAEEFAALPAPYSEANYARGRRTFKLCQSCHTITADGPNLVGPNLHGLFGREVGSIEGFTYSNAVAEADFVWTPEKLNEWLTSPRDFLPGNRMSFAGVRKHQDRLAVIAYIMSETGYTETPE